MFNRTELPHLYSCQSRARSTADRDSSLVDHHCGPCGDRIEYPFLRHLETVPEEYAKGQHGVNKIDLTRGLTSLEVNFGALENEPVLSV